MGEYVSPFSFKRDIFGLVEGPKYVVDKILSYNIYLTKCQCGFDNFCKDLEFCPKCGEKLVLWGEQYGTTSAN